MIRIALAFALALAASVVAAPTAARAADPIDGVWEQVDEDGEVGALILIRDRNGIVDGVISDLLQSQDPKAETCDKCSGAKKGKRLIGLAIIENMRRQGDVYSGGTITDPEDGKEYTARMTLAPDGRTLDVRGYVGTPLLGRTQTWRRHG